MSKSGGAGHDILKRRPLRHASMPRLDMGPVLDVDAQEAEHARHGEGKVRQVCEAGLVFQGNVCLIGGRESLVEDVPLLDCVGAEPVGGAR